MSDATFITNTLVKAVVAKAARATMPFQQAITGRMHGTAFWYNDLVDETPEHERIRQFLVTAEAVTHYDLAQWTLRAELCQPEMSAERLLMRDFADGWIRLPDLGIAVMPTGGLHAYAHRKGWEWTTDEITEGLASTESDVEDLGGAPTTALILGHDVGPHGERLQAMVVGGVFRDSDGVLRWDREMPDGFAGAPVFVGRMLDESRFKLVCRGVVLPGEHRNVIVSFDRIRPAIRALS